MGQVNLREQLHAHWSAIASGQSQQFREAQALATVVLPAAIAGLELFDTAFAKLAQGSLLLVVVALGLIAIRTQKTPQELVIVTHRALDEANQLKEDMNSQEQVKSALKTAIHEAQTRYDVNRAMWAIVEPLLKDGQISVPELENSLELLLDLLVSKKRVLFGFDDELWNFGIYLWSAQHNVLTARAVRRPTGQATASPHRSWAPGEGHVGLAFEKAKELVCEDARHPAIANMIAPNADNTRSYDNSSYVSLASIPIRSNVNDDVYGVVVATSNVPGRFVSSSEANSVISDTVEPLRMLAQVLVVLLQSADVDYVELEEERDGQDD